MKRIISFFIFLFASLALKATNYYVAPTGSDSNPGTISQPWRTWQKGFSSISAGDILYIRGGTYTGMYGSGHGVNISSKSGTSSSPITVTAYPGEIPVLDCSSLSSSAGVNFGILMRSCNYWHIKGLTVKNVREYRNLHKSAGGSPTAGWELGNCKDVTFELCNVAESGNGFTLNGTVYNIKYINCDAYRNYDYYDSGGLANGFNGNIRSNSTISYKGCRAWANSDDGWDMYGGSGYFEYIDCWAYRNGKDVPTIGNGDGFKLGYDASQTDLPGFQRTLKNCISADNYLMGFDEGMDVGTSMDMVVYNCLAYKNVRDYGFRFYQPSGTGRTTLKNNISFGNKVNYQGRSRNTTDHNTWDSGAPSVSDADFASTDMTQLLRPRKSDGSLPDIEFGRLKSGSRLIDAGINVGIAFLGSAPDLGAFESGIATSPTTVLSYENSEVKSTSTSEIEVRYNLTLSTSSTPALSCFQVTVNSAARSISKLTMSGKNVYLTLSSPVKNGDVVIFSYTKPSTNPLQCTGGTQAVSITNKSVTNSVFAQLPVFVSASVDDDNPDKIEMTYNTELAAVLPAAACFVTTINGQIQSVISVTVSNNAVILTLPVAADIKDTITVAYNQPATNPLQTTAGGKAATLSEQLVVNNILGVKTGSEIIINDGKILIYPNPAKEFIIIANFNPGDQNPVLRLYDFAGKLCQEIRLKDTDRNRKIPIDLKPGFFVAQLITGTAVQYVQKIIVIR
jgi:uncharacterized repeat protein (TIGR02059 family)